MTTCSIQVKWNTKVFKDVDVDMTGSVAELGKTIEGLTGVPAARQKIMGPKGMLKEGNDLSKQGLKPGIKLMVIGTAAGQELQKPQDAMVFVEDLSADEKVRLMQEKKMDMMPMGLVNLGTTCYFSSVLQFMRVMSRLITSIKETNYEVMNTEGFFYRALRELLMKIDSVGEPIKPIDVIVTMRHQFPQFAPPPGQQEALQQDAEECFVCMMQMLRPIIPKAKLANLMDFTVTSTMKCDECEEEVAEGTEEHVVLKCFLGSQTNRISHLHEGIELGLTEKLDRLSPTLHRNAQYTKVSKIASLPEFIVVHMVRFEWKEANTYARSDAGRTKICRKVQFAQSLDIHSFCNDEVKRTLRKARAILLIRSEKEASQRNALTKKTKGEEEKRTEGERGNDTEEQKRKKVKEGGDVNMEADKPTTAAESEVRREENAAEVKDKQEVAGGGGEGEGAQPLPTPTGSYELVAMVSHKGRTATAGHYVAWTLKEKDTWYKWDDEKVTSHQWKNIDLQGGCSDPHIAVLLLYRRLMITPTAEEDKESDIHIAQVEVAEAAAAEKEREKEEEEKKKSSGEGDKVMGVSL